MRKLTKVIYNWIDQSTYQYFLTQPDGIDVPNCTDIVDIDRDLVKAIDGDTITEQANINSKTWRKVTEV